MSYLSAAPVAYCLNPECPRPQNPDTGHFCLACGTTLALSDRYVAQRLLGRGGFGRTFLGVDRQKPSHPPCVIKQLHPAGGNLSPKAVELFAQEAHRLEELGPHPQIPDLYAYCQQEQRQYIVQEFIDGEDLAARFARQGCFTPLEIVECLKSLLPVLAFIHQGQVIHRDIKPENILQRRSDGLLLLVDFGAAKLAATGTEGLPGTRIGSLGFTAPEQLMGKAVFASDLYSLGATCLYLLTGIAPHLLYDPTTETVDWRSHGNGFQVPAALGEVLDRLVAPSLKLRFDSAVTVLQRLQELEPMLRPWFNKQPLPLRTGGWCCRWRVQGVPSAVRSLGWARGCLVAGSDRADVAVFAANTGEVVWQSRHAPAWVPRIAMAEPTVVKHLATHPESGYLASAGSDPLIHLWEVATGKLLRTLRGHTAPVLGIQFTLDGQGLRSFGSDRQLLEWAVQKNSPQRSVALDELSHIPQAIGWSEDAALLAIATPQSVLFVNAVAGCFLAGWELPIPDVQTLCWAPQGTEVLLELGDGRWQHWQVNPPTQLAELEPLEDTFKGVGVWCDRGILRGDRQGVAYRYAANTLQEAWDTGCTDITCMAVQGTAIAIATAQGTVAVWEQLR
ncbi:protein kinase domain-containing protein [Parathermosynechococcus lividus]